MKKLLKSVAQRFGYDILHLPTNPTLRRQLELLRQHRINLIFDVGANTGQFGRKMRGLGFTGRLVSFEPLPDAFRQLEATAEPDGAWTVVHTAIGRSTGTVDVNVSRNSYSSSILNVLPVHVDSAPESVVCDRVTVPILPIDSVLNQYVTDDSRLLVKIDTQGYERPVFEGCLHSLPRISGFQMELSLLPLYEGETLMLDMVDLLREHGYKLMLVEGGHQNYDTGELLQVEGFFYRNNG